MTKRELEKYKKKLFEAKIKLLRELGVGEQTLAELAKEATGDLSSFSIHIADQSGENYRRELKASITSKQVKILRAIDDALKRIFEGSYGKCCKCGGKIQKSRLDYLPYARHCIDCQRLLDGE